MSRLDSHISDVRTRMTFAILVDWLATCVFVLAVLSLLLIILQRLVHFGVPRNALWIGVGAGAAVAVVMAFLRRPSREAAAVAIDERLGLKEKFSTALSVRSVSDPFAQA